MLGWAKTKQKIQRRVMLSQHQRMISARYDAAQTTTENTRHWAEADACSADSSATAYIRQTLRNRSRYEVANNSYAKGIILTLANDTIGTGPKLQMRTEDAEKNSRIERDFLAWANEIGFAEKLRTMKIARSQDGESFAIFITNQTLKNPIKLDLFIAECDRISANPWMTQVTDDDIDGIKIDKNGNPIEYKVLQYHPGDMLTTDYLKSNTYKASDVIHYFRKDRPEQHRGLPEILPAIPLFAQLRRYTLAVIAAAESAANFAGILYSDGPASDDDAQPTTMDTISLERNMLLTMPAGWKMSQLEPHQPSSTYAEFKQEILCEIARCLNIPYNIAACNSSSYNYASGRLDHQTYYTSIKVDQNFTELCVLNRVFEAWYEEYSYLNTDVFDIQTLDYGWMWDGKEHVDPAKEANAQETRLRNYTTSLADEYAKTGKDWESQLRQIAREKKLMKELGLTMADITKSRQIEQPEEIPDDEREEARV